VRTNAFVAGGAVAVGLRGRAIGTLVHLADWYATLCAAAGVGAADAAAKAAGLPAVDSVSVWAVLNGSVSPAAGAADGLRAELQLSNQSLIVWPHKIVIGVQPYDLHVTNGTSPENRYPCNHHALRPGGCIKQPAACVASKVRMMSTTAEVTTTKCRSHSAPQTDLLLGRIAVHAGGHLA